ncbi:unnamed protein product [Schistosoma curassoni]|uniref:Reverse transcriptase domain-containing protein n=1 Tax=Schistosoma curassoni TaxID=6186 RepID=A0A183KCF1_9TREM|nr:unnamed protein product [Schistosoma curassoni]
MKQLYDATKKLAGRYSKPERPVKDKEGRPINEIQQQRNRWVEYFEELLNRVAPMNPPNIEAAQTDLPIDVIPLTTEEIRMSIRQVKSGKAAAGPDNIPAEALKLDSVRIGRAQTKLRHYGSSSNNQLSDTHRYTPTSLIMKRLDASLIPLTLRKPHRRYGVPEEVVNIIQNSYDGLQCKIVHRGRLTDAFQVSTRVRQVCLLSTFLFLQVVDWTMKISASKDKHGILCTPQNQLDDLDFTDDLALLSHTHKQMQVETASVAAVSASVGLNIQKDKTKVPKYNVENTNPITLDDETLEDVKSHTYLGSIINEQGGSDADVKGRIGKVRAAFLQLKNIWNSKQLTANQHQSQNLQYERQDRPTVRSWNVENYYNHHQNDASIYK